MRSTLFFAVSAIMLISAQAWSHPEWSNKLRQSLKDHMKKVEEHVAAMKQHLPPHVQEMLKTAMTKLDEHQVKKEVHNAMEKMHHDLMSKWSNTVASQGLKVHDRTALEAMMRNMMLAYAQHNMERSTLMTSFANHLATHFMHQRSPTDVKAFGAALSSLAHKYLQKYMDGTEDILCKNGVHLDKQKLQMALHRVSTDVMNGKPMMDSLMAEMKNMGIHTEGLDGVVQHQLKAHFENMKSEGMAELQKLMAAHKVPIDMNQAVAMMKAKGSEIMEKMKAIAEADHHKYFDDKMHKLAKKAFKHIKPEQHKVLMMNLRLTVKPAMNNHFQMIAAIFKNHRMGDSHTVIHYTIYHGMKQETHDFEDRHRHHHHFLHRKISLALMIGGSVFGIAVLVSLIIVLVHMVKEKRRGKPRRTFGTEEKSSLPYSIMDEKYASKA